MKDETLPQIYFVCGTRRSGTDLLLDFLSVPRHAGWIPKKLADHPENLSYATRVHKQNWFLLGEFFLERRFRWKSVPEPAMDGRFLAHYLSGFDLEQDHPVVPGPDLVTEEERNRLIDAVKTVAYRERRNNLVMGYEGFPRIAMLRSVFPNAKFIQIIRDPRSVAYQMIRKIMKVDHSFLDQHEAYVELMPPVLQERYRELPETPISFCGVYTRWLHELYRQEMASLPAEDQLEVAYSDLLSRPEKTLKKVLTFTEYPFDKRFKYYLKFHDIQISNQRTNRNLSSDEAEQLAQAVAPVE